MARRRRTGCAFYLAGRAPPPTGRRQPGRYARPRPQPETASMARKDHRIEHDSMGELEVPADALWGAQTQRAVQNFPVSGRPMPRGFIRGLGLVKAASAGVNAPLGLWPKRRAAASRKAALEGADGPLDAQRATA